MELFTKINNWIKINISSETNPEDNKEVSEYKILVLGDKAVGKSSLINSFCVNEFSLEIKPSQNCECYVKIIKLFEQTIKLYIIDTVESVLSSERKELYDDVKGVVVLYDITKNFGFEKIDKWIIDVRQMICPELPILLVGNKKDLTYLRNIDYEEGQEKALKNKCEFLENSSLDILSVDGVFKYLVAMIYFHELPETKKRYFRIAIKEKESSK